MIVGWPAAASARDRLRVARVRRVGVAQVQEHAVVAVGAARRASGSSAIGRMPRPCLPVDSATSCSAHSPNDAIGGSTTNVSLSRPPQRQLAERGAEPQARVALGQLAVLRRHLRALEHRLHVDARERGRHDAERRQRGVAPADLGVGEEDVAEALVLGQLGASTCRDR